MERYRKRNGNKNNMNVTFEIKEQLPMAPVGWLDTFLPENVMTRLQNYIETAKKDPKSVNGKLSGNVSKSLSIEDKDNWFFQNVLVPHIQQFMTSYPGYLSSTFTPESPSLPFHLANFWVNFQKQHEFNPPHNHGGIWSFVVWVKIPTDFREQHALPFSANSHTPRASDFEFQYTTMLGDIVGSFYNLDKTSEGSMLFFPSKLMHSVFPFYECDEERVSISGNIHFDIPEKKWERKYFE
jgi:hypothetical protein